MSIDLLDQLAEYGADHRARQAPVEQHEILARVRELDERVEEPLDETRRTRSIMLVAAAAVVAIVAGLALFSGRDPSEPADVPGTDLIDMVETTLPSTSIDPSPTTSSSTTSTTTPSTGGGTTDEQAAPVPQPVVLAPQLAAPVNGETQESIVGDITWTRIEGDITTVPSDIAFELDGVFYGNRLSYGGGNDSDPQPQWWRSPDGVSWAVWDDVPPNADLTVAAGTIWATSSGLASNGTRVLRYWDGTGFVTVELPPSDEVPGEGLTVGWVSLTIAAEDEGGLVVERREQFRVPWEQLLGIEPPLQAFEEGGGWEGTFRVRALECTQDGPSGLSCGSRGEPQTWRIRPEIVDGTPTRIDLYDAETGVLITSIVPPDDGRPIDEVLWGLGAENVVGTRTENFVVDRDGSNSRPIDWSFGPYPGIVELSGRRFVLFDGDDGALQLWVNDDDDDSWEELAVPAGVDPDGFSRLSSDGSTMILTTVGPYGNNGLLVTNHPMWVTTDGVRWTAWESPLAGHSTRGAESADFGWFDFHDANVDPEAPPYEAPLLAISPDAETWQAIPIPVPAALADRGLTWADRGMDDGSADWDWEAYVYGDTVFVALTSFGGDQARELWVGRVTTS